MLFLVALVEKIQKDFSILICQNLGETSDITSLSSPPSLISEGINWGTLTLFLALHGPLDLMSIYPFLGWFESEQKCHCSMCQAETQNQLCECFVFPVLCLWLCIFLVCAYDSVGGCVGGRERGKKRRERERVHLSTLVTP